MISNATSQQKKEEIAVHPAKLNDIFYVKMLFLSPHAVRQKKLMIQL